MSGLTDFMKNLPGKLGDAVNFRPNHSEDFARATYLRDQEIKAGIAVGKPKEPNWDSLMAEAARWRKNDRAGLDTIPSSSVMPRLAESRASERATAGSGAAAKIGVSESAGTRITASASEGYWNRQSQSAPGASVKVMANTQTADKSARSGPRLGM